MSHTSGGGQPDVQLGPAARWTLPRSWGVLPPGLELNPPSAGASRRTELVAGLD